ncbi:MAG: putative DNA binding domain-containing protein [Leptospiraceae bacterium]|nr:putative DNA binding domain-containing protein [Leptospiraceae bacterium]
MQDLIQRIKAGEDSITEFKNEAFHNESLAKEIVAFSNMKGGHIWIGIDDDGIISGIKDPKIEERVINICRNLVEPSVLPEILSHYFESDKKVLEVIVSRGDFKPYKVKGQNRIYIRVGSVSIEPSIPELVRLLQSGGQYHFEISSLPGTEISDFDQLRFREYCEKYRNTEFEESKINTLLQNFQLINKDSFLTVAGMLFFGNQIEHRLPQAGISMLYFDGNDKTGNILDQKEITSSIPECIESALKFVQNNSKVKGLFSQDDFRRQDIHEYDSYIIRELIANAFCHRDWSIFGQRIRLFCFRIE